MNVAKQQPVRVGEMITEKFLVPMGLPDFSPHISPIDAKIAPDFFRLRAPANESIVILPVE